MSFSYVSCLPKNISEQDKRDKVSSFDCDIDTIKSYLTEIANTYLLVAYRIYEIYVNKSYKVKYKNIVDACYAELGFKKSTTYNMINICLKFGEADSSGRITYSSLFGVNKFSYSQLCEMLSLSDKQRIKVTPEMSIKEIREIKKEANVIDVVTDPVPLPDVADSSDLFPDKDSYEDLLAYYDYSEKRIKHLIDLDVEHNREIFLLNEKIKSLENFQTSGKICYDTNSQPAYSFCCSNCNNVMDVDVYTSDEDFITDDPLFCPYCGFKVVTKDDYYNNKE